MSRGFRPYSKILLSTIKKFFRLLALSFSFLVVYLILYYKNIVLSIATYKIIVFILDNYNEVWYTVYVIKFGGIRYERNRRTD